MTSFPEEHKPGYAVYSQGALKVYDTVVLGLSNRLVWRCPTSHLEEHYRVCLSETHLEVGVGTGYFLDKVPFPTLAPEITLLDPNPECLAITAGRLERYRPRTVRADALVALPDELGRFKSIGLNYVLHCLPGSMSDKVRIIDHLIPHLETDGILFGATIVQGVAHSGLLARWLMRFYNSRGIFGNVADTEAGLVAELEKRFNKLVIERRGCVILFRAQGGHPR